MKIFDDFIEESIVDKILFCTNVSLFVFKSTVAKYFHSFPGNAGGNVVKTSCGAIGGCGACIDCILSHNLNLKEPFKFSGHTMFDIRGIGTPFTFSLFAK